MRSATRLMNSRYSDAFSCVERAAEAGVLEDAHAHDGDHARQAALDIAGGAVLVPELQRLDVVVHEIVDDGGGDLLLGAVASGSTSVRAKQEVTSAVIDDFVNDYIESLQFWNEHRTPGDIEGSLAGVVTVMRVGVFEHSSFRRALDTRECVAVPGVHQPRGRPHGRLLRGNHRAGLRAEPPIDIGHVYETFYIRSWASGLRRTHRDVPDEVLRDIIAQTLHMERETKRKPVQTG